MVAIVPGIGFGPKVIFRFSFATDIVTIERGLEELQICKKFKKFKN